LFHIPIYFKKLLTFFLYKKEAALQSYWMPHASSENPFKRKVSCLLVQMHPVSQAVLCALKGRERSLRFIYNI